MNFKKSYEKATAEKKLDFLTQLLEKDSSLQQQFVAFTKEANLDKITGVSVDSIRDTIWDEISSIDTDDIMENNYCSYEYGYYEDGEAGYDIMKNTFAPYSNEFKQYITKGNYLDAFRTLLAIYEVQTLEEPDVSDNNYYIFGDAIDEYIKTEILDCFKDFNESLEKKVLSVDVVKKIIELFFERYLTNGEYKFSYFENFFKTIIENNKKATYFLDKLKEHDLYLEDSAVIVIYCAKITGDNELFLKTANGFIDGDKEIAIELLKKYGELNHEDDFEKLTKSLLEKEDARYYALTVIDNINSDKYQEIYIQALKIHILYQSSMEHYMILREYLSLSKRLEFIEKSRSRDTFYVQLLEVEEEYSKIASFIKGYNGYSIMEVIKPIISIYPTFITPVSLK
jgi:hypothetical protein